MNRSMLALLMFAVGCAPKAPPQPITGTAAAATQPAAVRDTNSGFHSIYIGPLNGWNLSVRADGSGTVGYGAGDYGQFPAGTLDFNEMVRVLQQEPTVPGYGPTRGTNYGLDWPDLREGTTRHVRDRELVLPWVKKAFDAIPSRPARMDEIWKIYPPAEITNDVPLDSPDVR